MMAESKNAGRIGAFRIDTPSLFLINAAIIQWHDLEASYLRFLDPRINTASAELATAMINRAGAS